MYHPRQTPYGDIYSVNQGHVDALANRLYAEQKQREAQKDLDNKMLDNEFSKELAGVKKVDIPDLAKAYGDFKQAHIGLQKLGNRATPQDQYNVLQKKADLYSVINSSKEDKERIKGYMDGIKTDKKGKYDVNAAQMATQFLNTPTSKRDLSKDNSLYYQYSVPNIDKEIANAAGKGEEIKLPTGAPSVKGSLYDDNEVYKKINNPNVFYNNLFTGLAARPDHDNFSKLMDNSLTDEEKNALTTQYYAKIADPKFKSIYGDVQPFPASAGNTDLGKAVALKTMQAVVNLPLTPVRTESVANAERQMDKRRKDSMDDWFTKNRITQQQHLARIKLNNEKGGTYDIDNVPLKLQSDVKIMPTPQGSVNVVDVTDYPDSFKDDIANPKRDKHGVRVNSFINVGGREYLKVREDGNYELDGGKVVTPKDILINTNNRTVKLEKPIGTGKAEVRGINPAPVSKKAANKWDKYKVN